MWRNADSLGDLNAGDRIQRWEDDIADRDDALQPDPARRPGYLPRGVNRRPTLEFSRPGTHIDFCGWRPPAVAAAYAAVRKQPHPCEDRRRAASDRSDLGGRSRQIRRPARRNCWSTIGNSRQWRRKASKAIYSTATRIPRSTLFRQRRPHLPPRLQRPAVRGEDPRTVFGCVITTSKYEERGADRTLVVTSSRNQGRTCSEPAGSIEPPETARQPSWGTLYVAPYGRVYVYNFRERKTGPSPVGFFFKYSDDHGQTWSAERSHPDAEDLPRSPVCGRQRLERLPAHRQGGNVLVSPEHAFRRRPAQPGPGLRIPILTTCKRSATRRCSTGRCCREGVRGIRADHVTRATFREEHIITPLSGDDLLCIPANCDRVGLSQLQPRRRANVDHIAGLRGYRPAGRSRIKQPVACCRPFPNLPGRYLLWFHNAKPLQRTALTVPATWCGLPAEKRSTRRGSLVAARSAALRF